MGRRPAEEAVVIVKPGACDPAVTSVRVKQRDSDKEAGGEGRTTEAVLEAQIETVDLRPARRGAGECPRRRHRVNRRCDGCRKARAKRGVK